jgi:glycosyltransferase involved in cell wall biosynthesis
VDHAVRFLGHVAHTDVARELAHAHVFLHMSWEDTERLPNVVKEAMASHCVCVVTQTEGIEELVQDGVSGFVVPPRDVQAAASRVEGVFSGQIDVTSLTAAASSHIARFFTVSRSMQSYIDRWQEASSQRFASAQTSEANSSLSDNPHRQFAGAHVCRSKRHT